MSPSNARRGFSLIEMLIVVALISTAAVFIYQAVRYRQQSQAADSYITLQAREMAEFARAVQGFAAENKASWTANARQTITPAQLITANKLSNTWAQRGGTAGVTPIGETYRAFAIKDNAGVVRIVTADFGRNPTDSLVRRTGYQSTASSLQGYKARVADQMTRDFKGYAGYVSAGSMSARGPSGAFTQDLTAYFANSAPMLPVTVELVGWPEYRRPGGEEEQSSVARQCFVVSGAVENNACRRNQFGWQSAQCWGQSSFDSATHYQEPTLPAGATNVTRVPMCGDSFQMISTGVPGIALTSGTGTTTTREILPACDDQFGNRHVESLVTNRSTVQEIQLNNVTVFEEICGATFHSRNPSTCAVVQQNQLQPVSRVLQQAPITINTVNGQQTYQPLQPMSTNVRSTGNATTRGHWFYCLPNV